MLYMVPYFAGLFIMLVIRLWILHRHKRYYIYVIYMTLVLTGAYGFSRSLLADQGFVYIFILTIGMALFAAYITRTSLVEEPTEAK